MPLLLWILTYIVEMLFWIWIAFRGGAERLDGTWLANIVHLGASDWSPESMKLVAWFFMLTTTFWFIWGMVDPGMRFYNAQLLHNLDNIAQ